MKTNQKLVALCLVGLLALPVVAVQWGERVTPERQFTGELTKILPSAPAGWTRTARPIADSPELQEAVDEILIFDEGVFFDYQRSAERLSVYAAYWAPGRMSPRLVAGHNPDVCWVGNGWESQSSDLLDEVEVDGRRLPEIESRSYTQNGQLEYVWFWHVVGSRVRPYGDRIRAPWHAVFTDLFERGLGQREEQFFIRLSSNRPLTEFMNGPVLPELLKRLPLPAAQLASQ